MEFSLKLDKTHGKFMNEKFAYSARKESVVSRRIIMPSPPTELFEIAHVQAAGMTVRQAVRSSLMANDFFIFLFPTLFSTLV